MMRSIKKLFYGHDDDIQVDQLLGKGTYGEVYKVAGKDLAMKQMKIDDAGIPELKELNLLRIINHPNILHLDSFVIKSKYIGLILPLASRDLMSEPARDEATSIRWMYQLLSAIHFLHKNSYFHCDIKPANILIINDNAVLSDLGLTGNVMKIGVCQSIASPQLFNTRGGGITGPFGLQTSNEYQDDIWALGVTFLYIITRDMKKLYTAKGVNEYVNSDYIQFLRSRVDEKFVPLLSRLMNPSASDRSLNLLELLALPIFSDHSDYIDGTIENAPNKTPVIFNSEIKIEMRKAIKFVLNLYKNNYNIDPDLPLPMNILFNALDMLYRVFQIIKTEEAFACCFYISAKIFGLMHPENLMFPMELKRVVKVEPLIVKHLNGYLSRQTVMDFIDYSKYVTFFGWLEDNPERYEQCSLVKIAEIVRSL